MCKNKIGTLNVPCNEPEFNLLIFLFYRLIMSAMDVGDLDGGEITFEIADGTEFVMNSEGRHVQVIDLGDSGISQEVEVVTIEAPISSRNTTLSASSQGRKPLKHPTTTSMNLQSLLRGKSAPALLRNSRRLQTAEQVNCMKVHAFIIHFYICSVKS